MLWQFLAWWCGLFGITDPDGVQLAVAVIAGGVLLYAIFFITAMVLGAITDLVQR